jgi:hypothetical protein
MADISKFGVPLGGSKLGLLQPKMTYKYRAVFLGMGFNADSRIMTQNLQTASRPKVATQAAQVHSYVSVAYVQGKHIWEPVELTFLDDITNGVVNVIGQQLSKQMNYFEQTQAVAGANYKFTTEIHTLDGTNAEELDKWVLDGCYILDYSATPSDYTEIDVLNKVTMQLRYDIATHIAGPNTNDGTTVGGDPFDDVPSPGGLTGVA